MDKAYFSYILMLLQNLINLKGFSMEGRGTDETHL